MPSHPIEWQIIYNIRAGHPFRPSCWVQVTCKHLYQISLSGVLIFDEQPNRTRKPCRLWRRRNIFPLNFHMELAKRQLQNSETVHSQWLTNWDWQTIRMLQRTTDTVLFFPQMFLSLSVRSVLPKCSFQNMVLSEVKHGYGISGKNRLLVLWDAVSINLLQTSSWDVLRDWGPLSKVRTGRKDIDVEERVPFLIASRSGHCFSVWPSITETSATMFLSPILSGTVSESSICCPWKQTLRAHPKVSFMDWPWPGDVVFSVFLRKSKRKVSIQDMQNTFSTVNLECTHLRAALLLICVSQQGSEKRSTTRFRKILSHKRVFASACKFEDEYLWRNTDFITP